MFELLLTLLTIGIFLLIVFGLFILVWLVLGFIDRPRPGSKYDVERLDDDA